MKWILLLTIASASSTDGGDGPGGADDATVERRVEEDSAPLREVREAEAQAHVLDGNAAEDLAASAASRLGLESPLRSRVSAALRRGVHSPEDPIALLPEIGHGLRRLQAEYDIPIDVNEAVVRYVRFFESPRIRPHFARWLARARRYAPRLRRILREEGVPEDTVYLAMIESGFANRATSRARAVGTWQFISETGRRFGLRQDFWVDERRDPEKAARAAARFLKELHAQTGDWRLAWAGYNAGPGRIARARRLGYSDFWHATRRGSVLPRETRAYVPKIMAAAILAKHAAAFGFAEDDIEPEPWSEHEEVVVARPTELHLLARAAQVPVSVLLDLNPELRRTCTPARPYPLRIPRASAPVFARNWAVVSERAARTGAALLRVRRGDTLAAISRAYEVPVDVLAGLNRLPSRGDLGPGAVLVVPVTPASRRAAEVIARRNAKSARRVRVEPGDTLSSIARKQGVTVEDLARWNGIRDPGRHRLHAGRLIALRQRGAPPAHAAKELRGRASRRVSASKTSHHVRVRSGDSLWSLARRLGVSIHDLARWNGIRRPLEHKLRAGRLLLVLRRAEDEPDS